MERLVFANANLLDGEHPPQPDSSVVVEGRRIAQVARGSVQSGPGDRVIDLAGRTLMPGLITCHFHSTYRAIGSLEVPALGLEAPAPVLALFAAQHFELALQCGFTSVACSSGPYAIDAALRDAIEHGIIPGPRVYAGSRELTPTADGADYGNRVWFYELGNAATMATADGPMGFRRLVREEMRRGADLIKINASTGHAVGMGDGLCSIEPDELRAATSAAHRRGKKVRCHTSSKPSILECARAGVDVIDHADRIDAECVEAILRAESFVAPTPLFIQRLLAAVENVDIARISREEAQELPFQPRGESGEAMMRSIREDFDHFCAMLPEVNRAGVKLVVGDDYGTQPLPHGEYALELEFYVKQLGIPALDVIRWATKNGAELMGRGADLGTIGEGKLADLLVVDGNPVSDIGCLADRDNLQAIIKDGEFYKDSLVG